MHRLRASFAIGSPSLLFTAAAIYQAAQDDLFVQARPTALYVPVTASVRVFLVFSPGEHADPEPQQPWQAAVPDLMLNELLN